MFFQGFKKLDYYSIKDFFESLIITFFVNIYYDGDHEHYDDLF